MISLKKIWEGYKEGWSNWYHFKLKGLFRLYWRLAEVGPVQWLEEWKGKKKIK